MLMIDCHPSADRDGKSESQSAQDGKAQDVSGKPRQPRDIVYENMVN